MEPKKEPSRLLQAVQESMKRMRHASPKPEPIAYSVNSAGLSWLETSPFMWAGVPEDIERDGQSARWPIYVWPKQKDEMRVYYSEAEFLQAFEQYSEPNDRLPDRVIRWATNIDEIYLGLATELEIKDWTQH